MSGLRRRSWRRPHVVLGQARVHLERRDADRERARERGQRVFGRKPARAAVALEVEPWRRRTRRGAGRRGAGRVRASSYHGRHGLASKHSTRSWACRETRALDLGLAYDQRSCRGGARSARSERDALVHQAYEMLSDPKRRAAYDAQLVTAAERSAAAEQATPGPGDRRATSPTKNQAQESIAIAVGRGRRGRRALLRDAPGRRARGSGGRGRAAEARAPPPHRRRCARAARSSLPSSPPAARCSATRCRASAHAARDGARDRRGRDGHHVPRHSRRRQARRADRQGATSGRPHHHRRDARPVPAFRRRFQPVAAQDRRRGAQGRRKIFAVADNAKGEITAAEGTIKGWRKMRRRQRARDLHADRRRREAAAASSTLRKPRRHRDHAARLRRRPQSRFPATWLARCGLADHARQIIGVRLQ